MKTVIGWVGLGKMGIPMSGRLLEAGYPLMVFNRTKGKADGLIAAGAVEKESPLSVIESSDVIIIMVSDDKAVKEIFTSADGLFASDATGRIIINMSTVSPDISREMALLCNKRGNHYLDAPVSGSVRQAIGGELVIMAGGNEDVFNQVRPVLSVMGKLVIRVGENGSGNIAKLAANTLLGIISQGYSESIAFAGSNGININNMVEIINNSAMSSVYLRIKGDAILGNNFQPAFALKHIAKDLRLAKKCGLDTPLGLCAAETFSDAEDKMGDEDIISIYRKFKR